jgi:hypothetical protein
MAAVVDAVDEVPSADGVLAGDTAGTGRDGQPGTVQLTQR